MQQNSMIFDCDAKPEATGNSKNTYLANFSAPSSASDLDDFSQLGDLPFHGVAGDWKIKYI